jgi:large subunit ribosomal protein L23
MDATYVIKKPLLTEKSTFAMNEEGRYSFLVDRRASKDEIKRAVESLYGVKVVGVTTQVRKGRERRLKYGWVTEKVSKKATVRLAEGQTIELF